MFYAWVLPSGASGIDFDWDSCRAKVSGVGGAKYKKFSRLDDANAFIRDKGPATGIQAVQSSLAQQQGPIQSSLAQQQGPIQSSLAQPQGPIQSSLAQPQNVTQVLSYMPPQQQSTPVNPVLEVPGQPIQNTHAQPALTTYGISNEALQYLASHPDLTVSQAMEQVSASLVVSTIPNVSSKDELPERMFSNADLSSAKRVKCYVDGSLQGKNPGYGIRFDDDDHTIIVGITKGNDSAVAETRAIEKAIQFAGNNLYIITDCQYCYNTATQLYQQWEAEGNVQSHPNYEIWQHIFQMTEGKNITIAWHRSHSGEKGNEIVDMLAKIASGSL